MRIYSLNSASNALLHSEVYKTDLSVFTNDLKENAMHIIR